MLGHTTSWIIGRSVTVYPRYPDLTYSVTGVVKKYTPKTHTIRLKHCLEATDTTSFNLSTVTFRLNEMLALNLEVKWDTGWIAGKTVRPHPHNSTILVDYADGDQIWTSLGEETFKIIGVPTVEYSSEHGFRLPRPETQPSEQQLSNLVDQLGSLLGHPSRLDIQEALSLHEGKLGETMEYLKASQKNKEVEAQMWVRECPASLVNYQISVRWRAGQWYQGYISCYDITSNMFYVHYADGDQEWVDLTQYPVILLTQVPLAATAPPEHSTGISNDLPQ